MQQHFFKGEESMKDKLTNLLITLLVAALLAVSFLSVSSGYGLFRDETADTEELLPSDVTETGSSERTDRFVLPEFIGARGTRLGSFGLMADRNSMTELYEFLAPYLSAALTTGRCEQADDGDTLWNTLLSEGEILYLRYHTGLRASVIAAHLCGKTPRESLAAAAGEAPEIRELILLLLPQGTTRSPFEVTVKDTGGTVYRYTADVGGYADTGEPLLFDTELFANATKLSGLSPFTFYGLSSLSGIPDYTKLSPSQPLLEQPPSASGIAAEACPSVLSEAALTRLGYLPSGYGSYTDTDNGYAVVYVSTHGTLRYGDGKITFSASIDGGIPLRSTAAQSDAASLYADLRAAELLVARLQSTQPELFGGDAELLLTSVGRTETGLILGFSYFLDNIEVLTEGREPIGMTLTVEDGKVIALDADALNVALRAYLVKNYQQATVLRILSPSVHAANSSCLRLVYRLLDGDSYTEWLLEIR